ncbi:MAG: hypothetical protein VX438_00445 [Planctomycetota bacterium]|nr:hypothetical protein [Planctomycetota bacterium]
MTNSIFPLPLTVWEEFFVVDDHEHYPANFMVRIRCQGRISNELFLTAVKKSQSLHPLFGCIIQKSGRQLLWVTEDSEALPVEFRVMAVGEPEFPLQEQFDVFKEKLWRLKIVGFSDSTGIQRTDIFLEIHHALCDGLGATQFLSDVANAIHRLDGNLGIEINRETALTSLKNRGKFPQSWRELFKGFAHHYRSVWASVQLAFSKIEPLVPVSSVQKLLGTPKEKLGYRKISLPSVVSAQLRRSCRLRNTTLNSVVAAELFRWIYQWKIDQGHPVPQALRIMIPVNERTLQDRGLSACNRVSVSPFTRSRRQIIDPAALLLSIEKGVRVLKKARLGLNFHRALWVCKTLFGDLKPFAKTDRVGATCVLSNIGNINFYLGLPVEGNATRCGPFLIDDLDLVAPLRIGTSFAVTLHEFNSETRLGIHYDSAMISEQQADDFFDHFSDRLTKLADS